MRKPLLITIILLVFCLASRAQAVDYREPFLGLYHTNAPPCINVNEQTPPNHYVQIEKDTSSPFSIRVTDTTFMGPTGFVHIATLHESDSTYFDGAQQARFIDDSFLEVYIPSWLCPPGHIYHLRKLKPVGVFSVQQEQKSLYLFPDPAVGSFTVLLPGTNEKSEMELLDMVTGKKLMKKELYGSSEIDVSTLPRGMYLVHISGEGFDLTKRIVLGN